SRAPRRIRPIFPPISRTVSSCRAEKNKGQPMSAEPLLADAPWLIAGGTARVLQLLNANGEEARVVGGAVRNALLGLAHGDIDIATTALPEEVMRRARAASIKSVPTGVDHGTVTLVIDSQPYEVTTL